MLNLNRASLAGRLTRDPESFQAGGATVAKWGIAVNQRRKNKNSGEWESFPTFVNLETWSSDGNTYQFDAVMDLRKGMAVYVEGKLKNNEWVDKNTGLKRSTLIINTDSVAILLESASSPDHGRPENTPPSRSESQDIPF